jgi:hypothetical protein
MSVLLAMFALLAPATPARSPIPPTRITIASARVPVQRGVALLRLSCSKGEAIMLTCEGRAELRGLGRRIGSARFAIPNCCSAPDHVVRLPLIGAARAYLRGHRQLRALALARLSDGSAHSSRRVVLR